MPRSAVATTSVQPPVADSISTSKISSPLSSTPESQKQSSISVTFISGETITKQAQAATTDDHSNLTTNKQQSADLSDGSISIDTKKKVNSETPDEKPKSSINVTLISGETITKQAQPTTTEDNSDLTANTRQSAGLSDGSINTDTKKKVNSETSAENQKHTEPVSGVQAFVSDSVSTLQSNTSVNPESEIKDQDDQTASTQQSVKTAPIHIPQEIQKFDYYQGKTTIYSQSTANRSPGPRERVKSRAEGHFTSELIISDNSDDPDEHSSHLSEIGTAVALIGGAVAVGGIIAGSTTVTAIGVTAAAVGGTCCLLKGK